MLLSSHRLIRTSSQITLSVFSLLSAHLRPQKSSRSTHARISSTPLLAHYGEDRHCGCSFASSCNAVELINPKLGTDGTVSDGEHLLSIADSITPPVQVILDVGAHILDVENRQVAQKWMSISSNATAQAALFFNNDEELMFITALEGKKPCRYPLS
ncbi:uncharacterized protein CC84DRAFT_143140 [Paraphaeosphaeria sporulosa]|uniref:Uncharacterized protein n=1 Tax=Paraphaeosphaeria sporulosa TaxID=1460663 RepID=A0A177CYM4_9PLEO|nr:uncharacterized protein CC84DRAFT_143140 [Paraphaeosphaeria sporulosa]OAG12645.1 hypothetical protein CC84DRAFT_143140 [Paraphaeosphaeria sporulosa]